MKYKGSLAQSCSLFLIPFDLILDFMELVLSASLR